MGMRGILRHVDTTTCKWRGSAVAGVIGFLLLAHIGKVDGAVAFPGIRTELAAPNGKLLLKNVDPADDEQPHQLILVAAGRPDRLIYRYGRHVDVSWSPSSRYIFVTDFNGSSESTCVLIDVGSGTSINLRSRATASNRQAAAILSNIHAYMECVKWLSSSEVLLKVWGYSDSTEGENELRLKYAIGGGFVRADAGPITQDPRAFLARIRHEGATAVIRSLWNTPAWNELTDRVSSGASGWVDVALDLGPGSDAGSTSELGDALLWRYNTTQVTF
jgi:hypothetical protein